MKHINIQKELLRAKENSVTDKKGLTEVFAILEKNEFERQEIQKNISNSSDKVSNSFDFALLKTENIFHITQIKKVCIDYRLRFLESKLFKGEIPAEAISKIRAIEKDHKTELKGFKVLAPSKMFKLKDKDDPVLFAPIGNGYFYLIHKWGNDLHPLRKIMMWPFKNIVNLVWFVLLISFLLTMLIPDGLFSRTSSGAQFGLLFFFVFKMIGAIVLYYGFAQGKNFSNAIWNSRYINT